MRYETAVPLGRGGTGKVLKAWDPELERHVAVKLLRFEDPEMVARIKREARLQAKVQHPNVAEVYEVGDWEGRPYIAMQLVDGVPIDEALEGLPLERRVEVLATVADAVHAAHKVGLIHRDLKPGNILVETGDDGTLTPYVVDFGIAREEAAPGRTVTGQVLGTPGYLSPEQARGETTGLDRRTDVFSLGVVLYQVLTGSRPFEADSTMEAMLEVLQKDPVPPRKKVASLPRDLETIVLKCLEKDPDHRYGSARALADDLERFLDGQPVVARPVGLVGRLRRRARRHPVVAGLLATAAAAVLVLGVALAVGAVKYTRDLARERNAAVAAREEAEEVAAFLASLFESASPYGAEGTEETTARELLARGAERIESELADRPLLRARLQLVIGRVQREVGLYEEAGEQLEAALATRRERLGEHHLDTARVHYELGRLRKEEGDYEAAIDHHQRAAADLERSLGDDSLELASVLTALSAAVQESGADEPDPFALYERTLAVYERAEEGSSPKAAQIKNNMALMLGVRGERERAESLFREALADYERAYGPDHLDVAQVLHNLGSLIGRGGRDFATSVAMLERALEIRTAAWGEEHPYVVFTVMNLAENYRLQGDSAEAERLLRRAEELAEPAGLPPDHVFFPVLLYDLTEIAARQGRTEGAHEAYTQARTRALEAMGNESVYSVDPLLARGELALAQGRLEKALKDFEKAAEIAREKISPTAPQALVARRGLGRTLRQQGRLAEAEEVLRELLADAAEPWEEMPTELDAIRRALAETLLDAGRAEEAATVLAAAEPPEGPPTPAGRHGAAERLLVEARLAFAQGDEGEARRLAGEARDLLAPVVAEHQDLPYHRTYARALQLLGEHEAAAPHRARLERAGWRLPEGSGSTASTP